MGGFGSAVLEALSDLGITHVRTKVLGLPDWYIEQGPQDLPAGTIWIDGGRHLRERERFLAQESETSRTAAHPGQLAAAGLTKKREQLGDEQGS